jgi:hypothetical protein
MVKSGNGRAPDGRASVIDQGAVFKGTITASSTVIVRGVLEGEITGPGLEVDATGVVVGHAKVTKLRSSGELEGTYEAEHAEVFGRLRDGVLIRADSLIAANSEEDTSHVFFGECELEIGPLPNQEQAVSEALALAAASSVAPAPSPPAGMDLGSQMTTRGHVQHDPGSKRDEDLAAAARGQKKNPADVLKPAATEIPPSKRLP